MFGSAYKIATVWGIPIKIHISLIVLLVFFALMVGLSGGLGDILIVLFLELCVFTSIALHELSHSFVALRKGCRVREITLMFIGGAAQMEEIPRKPADELQMALAGPALSVVLGLTLWHLGKLLPLAQSPLPFRLPLQGNIIQFVGVINLVLAGFNLIPSFPMDGGRVFRALLARRMGRLRATYVAARVGKVVAVLFGLYGFFATPTQWLLIAIAFFIFTAAGNEYRLVQMQERMQRMGGSRWWPDNEGPADDDKVRIGPPPFGKGPGSETDLRPADDDDWFRRLFR